VDFSKADKTTRNLKPKAAAYTTALGDGILCRVAPNGTKTLELRARLNGTVQRFRLGHYPATTITEAAGKAAEYRAMLKNGMSPKVAEQRAAGADLPRNLREAADRFIEGHLAIKAGAGWGHEAKRIIKSDVLPTLGHFPLQQLQRTDLTTLIESKARALRAKGRKGIAANRLAAVVSKFMRWCAMQGWVGHDLGTNLPKPAAEKAKDRVLSGEETGVFWNALTEAATTSGPILQPHARIMQLLAITGARCSEITTLTVADIDLKAGNISITDAKNDASNRTLPMAPAARAIIEARITEVGEGLLFPGPRAGKVIASNEISRTCRKLLKRLKLAPFTPHDLRRTAISIMAEDGIDGDIRRRITGHQAPDVHGRVYDRALRLDDMRRALAMIEGTYATAATKAAANAHADNVVPMVTTKPKRKA